MLGLGFEDRDGLRKAQTHTGYFSIHLLKVEPFESYKAIVTVNNKS